MIDGPISRGLECDPTPRADGCPPCSSPEGGRCRDQWYSSALRCSSDAQCGGAAGSCRHGYCVLTDRDGDWLDDDFEREIAERNFPKVLLQSGEKCGAPHGVIYRVRRHPENPRRIAIVYVVLYGVDCGELNGHLGDAETFAITVDLDTQPGAAATVGVAAWAHAGTLCASTSTCETAPATRECAQSVDGGAPTEVTIYASRNKHASYLTTSTCGNNCFDQCNDGERIVGPLLNVGQPGQPLVTDLTAQGFVQQADGWNSQLLHFNPWGTTEFSGGGRLDKPLSDLLAPPGR